MEQLNEHNKLEYPPMHAEKTYYLVFRQKNIRTKEEIWK